MTRTRLIWRHYDEIEVWLTDTQTDLVADWPPANSRVAFTIKGEENTLNYFSTNSIVEKCLISFTTSLSTEPLGFHKKNLRWRSTFRRPQCRSCTFTCHSQFGDKILRWRTWSTFVPTFSESFSARSHWAERELRTANVITYLRSSCRSKEPADWDWAIFTRSVVLGQCSQSPCQDTTEILLNMSLVFRISAESQDQDGEPLLG